VSDSPRSGFDRRRFVTVVAGLGAGTAFANVLWAAVEGGAPLDRGTLAAAEQVAGIEFTDPERDLMLKGLDELRADYAALRTLPLGNDVPPAVAFDPTLAGEDPPDGASWLRLSAPDEDELPEAPDALAFLSATELGRALRERRLTSVRLTEIYLDRLQRYDPTLRCVVSLTKDRALESAARADRELDRGSWRGPLHGVPWGAKDLLAARGTPTTWGAAPYKDQVIDQDATVVKRLDAAGAVLVAKLSLGALAWGDVWFGGTTHNPWNPEQGSSGSSAGPAAATSAGCVGFSIGSETLGSIVSPSTRCGATGLRPTFGRVSRAGAMALSWSMDKLGPICRSVDDCAAVFAAIQGADPDDLSAVDAPFRWPPERSLEELRVGYVRALFEAEPDKDTDQEWRANDLSTLETLQKLGLKLVPVELPDLPVSAMSFILSVEAAAAFDELTRSGRDDLLVRQVEQAWPNVFRTAQMVPAVEYLQANRARTLLMHAMRRALADVDAYVCPSFGGTNLLITNLTGHPAVVVPNGFRKDGTPTSITFCAPLWRDAEALLVAKAYQDATGFHLEHPPGFEQQGR